MRETAQRSRDLHARRGAPEPDLLLPVAADCVKLGIPVMALFPAIDPTLKTPDGPRNPEGLIPRVVRALKKEFPDLGVMTDVALTPSPATARMACWTTGYIINDQTVEILTAQAPDRMLKRAWTSWPQRHDGRPHWRHPRGAGGAGHIHTRIMAYSAKYASAFTAPSATRWEPAAPWARPTRTSTRWTPATATKPCAKWPSTSPKVRTW